MNSVRLFLLCCIPHLIFFFNACGSPEKRADPAFNYLQAYVDNSLFKADDVVVMVEDKQIRVIGNNTVSKQAIFLVFELEDKMVYTFGAENNMFKNEASFYLKDIDNEYSTMYVDEICGELILESANGDKGIISGTFFFEASDRENRRVKITSGTFMKKLY